jgi:hypothetical protein
MEQTIADRLEAIEAIRHLKARYFRYMDTKQWESLPGIFTPDMQVLSPNGQVWHTSAKAIWAMQDQIEWKDRHPREGWKSINGRGHYHDTYRQDDGVWRIATLSLTRLRLDITWP